MPTAPAATDGAPAHRTTGATSAATSAAALSVPMTSNRLLGRPKVQAQAASPVSQPQPGARAAGERGRGPSRIRSRGTSRRTRASRASTTGRAAYSTRGRSRSGATRRRRRRCEIGVGVEQVGDLRYWAPLGDLAWSSPHPFERPKQAEKTDPPIAVDRARDETFRRQATNGGIGGISKSCPLTSTTPGTLRATSTACSRAAVPSSRMTPRSASTVIRYLRVVG